MSPTSPAPLPVAVDLLSGVPMLVQRAAAIERLVAEHHLARADAQDHVDGVLAEAEEGDGW